MTRRAYPTDLSDAEGAVLASLIPLSRLLANEPVVFGMGADPDPVDAACFLNAQGSIMIADTD